MMTDSTRRSLRTLAHGVVAAALAVPALSAALPTPPGRIGEIAATLVGACAIVAKIVNVLEDRGLMPAFFKAPPSPGADPIPAPPVDATVPAQPAGDDPPPDPAP